MRRRRVRPAASSPPTLHIVASCTNRKSLPVASGQRLGQIRAATVGARLTRWWAALLGDGPHVKAIDLYRGQHWSVVRELPQVARARGFIPSLWVASAGYGLVSADAQLRAYSATFASGEADAVAPDERATWWNLLAAQPGPIAADPRSLATLAERDPVSTLLVIASPAYVSAMRDDLGAACDVLGPRLLIITSTDTTVPPELREHVLVSGAPLSKLVGGARTSLHARTARRLIADTPIGDFRADVLRPRLAALVQRLAGSAAPQRPRMTDDQVRTFITRSLRTGTSCTALLRQLRASGRACEQRRFSELYHAVREAARVA